MNKKKERQCIFLSASIDFTAQHLSCKESINDPFFGLLMLRAHSFAHPPFQSTTYPLSRVVVGGY